MRSHLSNMVRAYRQHEYEKYKADNLNSLFLFSPQVCWRNYNVYDNPSPLICIVKSFFEQEQFEYIAMAYTIMCRFPQSPDCRLSEVRFSFPHLSLLHFPHFCNSSLLVLLISDRLLFIMIIINRGTSKDLLEVWPLVIITPIVTTEPLRPLSDSVPGIRVL